MVEIDYKSLKATIEQIVAYNNEGEAPTDDNFARLGIQTEETPYASVANFIITFNSCCYGVMIRQVVALTECYSRVSLFMCADGGRLEMFISWRKPKDEE